MSRWTLMGDTHCGSTTGLTSRPQNPVQKALLLEYKRCVKWAGAQPDVLLLNGDGWDGKDEKGKDITEHCMYKQAEDCAELICMHEPREEVILITGTHYHVRHKGQEFDEACKKHIQYTMLKRHGIDIKVSVKRHLHTTINGWFYLDARHFIGGSTIPHGRATAQLRSQSWNVLRSAVDSSRSGRPAKYPHLMVRSHRHYYMATETIFGDAVVLPGWQAEGGVYGEEICEGIISLGIMSVEIGKKETDGWRREKRISPAAVVPYMESR